MAPPRLWADLPAELLLSIADRLIGLRCYLAARGVCTAWRSALAPASPHLLYVFHLRDDARRRTLAVSVPLERPFHLTMLDSSSWCVGSIGGWLAVITVHHVPGAHVALLNPLTGQEIALPYMEWNQTLDSTWPWVKFKIVFARNPRPDDFTVVAACGEKTLAYVSAGDATWSFQEITWDTEIADVVYHNGGGGGGSKFYCLTKSGDVLAVHVPRGGGTKPVLEPLLPGVPSDPDDIFAPPYNRVSEHTSAKYLVFCEGNMYQIWRNMGDAIDLWVTGSGSFHMSKNEVFVLRYAPAWCGPCWEAVEDLGGHSVFVGLNNAVSVRAEGLPDGLKGNCVYWASEFEREEAIVFDMQTRRANPCLAPSVGATCWYLLGDTASSNKNNGCTIYHHQQQQQCRSIVEKEPELIS